MRTVPIRRQPCLLIINMIASVHIICEGSTELTANIFNIKYVGCWPQGEELFPQVFSSSHNNITGIRDFEPCFLLIWREDMMSPDKPTCFKYSMLEPWKRDILMLFHFLKNEQQETEKGGCLNLFICHCAGGVLHDSKHSGSSLLDYVLQSKPR